MIHREAENYANPQGSGRYARLHLAVAHRLKVMKEEILTHRPKITHSSTYWCFPRCNYLMKNRSSRPLSGSGADAIGHHLKGMIVNRFDRLQSDQAALMLQIEIITQKPVICKSFDCCMMFSRKGKKACGG